MKTHKRPEPFISCFHTDYASYNLNYANVEINSNLKSNNSYNGFQINTGINDTSKSTNNTGKINNPNLIDFDFSNSSNPQTINNNQNNTNNVGNIPNKKINDINDIFDAFNNK